MLRSILGNGELHPPVVKLCRREKKSSFHNIFCFGFRVSGLLRVKSPNRETTRNPKPETDQKSFFDHDLEFKLNPDDGQE